MLEFGLESWLTMIQNSSAIPKVYAPSYFRHTCNRAWLTELTWQTCGKLSRRSIGIFDLTIRCTGQATARRKMSLSGDDGWRECKPQYAE